ncbi:MAG: hypothetical protein Q8N88_02850 [Nanoarchaeota archaeon]|nr:hypothetical protein [Nanoarchaeota archaeon]
MRGNRVVLGVLLIICVGVVWGLAVSGYLTIYNTEEQNGSVPYYFNFSENVSLAVDETLLNYSIDDALTNKIYLNNALLSSSDISSWISINTSTGILIINSTFNNRTGLLQLPLAVSVLTGGGGTATMRNPFNFTINATNDVPNLTSFQREYNLSQEVLFSSSVSASDEENHYPLKFNFDFINNCTHAEWSGRNANENCSILNLTSANNITASFDFTPTANDVGTYWAYLNVSDAGENYYCPHIYCNNATYQQNKTGENNLVKFNIFSSLDIDATNCTGQTLMENENFRCHVNITTKGADDNLTISSSGSFRTDSAVPHNSGWFFADNNTVSSGFKKIVDINITPAKRDVGNWSINFSVSDSTENQNGYELIYLYVNYTESDTELQEISDLTVYKNTTFRVNATDDDLLIKDSGVKSESLSFASNVSWISFSNIIINHDQNYVYPLALIDYSNVINFGEVNYSYSVKVNATDSIGNFDEKIFTIRILNDTAPEWNDTNYTYAGYEGNRSVINLTELITDADGDDLNFSFSNTSRFDNFNLTISGIINFSSADADVGYHNITISATDGKLSSDVIFNFSIFNVNDPPDITGVEADNDSVVGAITAAASANESNLVTFYLSVEDDDFLIPLAQSSFYLENLSINASFANLTAVSLIPALSFAPTSTINNLTIYSGNFTFNQSYVGTYNVTMNVTDKKNLSDSVSFNFTINPVNDMPNLTFIENQTAKVNDIFYLDINATDAEDGDENSGNLTFSIDNKTTGGDFLVINSATGEINISLNDSYDGTWEYEVSVNDSEGGSDSQVFRLSVFGSPNITFPAENYVFNFTEGNSSGAINFSLTYPVNNTNLTYRIYIDKITYSNSTFNYTDLNSNGSLRNETTFLWTENNISWEFTPNYTDETYGNLKNLTIMIFNPDYPELNESVNFKTNISHANSPVRIIGGIGSRQSDYNTDIEIDLSNYFADDDKTDEYYNENVSFAMNGSENISYSPGWIMTILKPGRIVSDFITITASDNSSNVSIGNIQINFTEPATTTVTTPSPATSGGSSSVTSVKLFSIRIIVPRDIIISDENYIEVPFQLENNGQVDISGISLSNLILFNNEFSDDIRIEMEPTYLEKLTIDESKDFILKISANTQKAGRYKATIFANATTPKFSDWGDFFIELKKINETNAENVIIFTEKLIADNPECLELTEIFNEAKKYFEDGNYSTALTIAQRVADACEKIIRSNEQIRNMFGDIVDNIFYYLSITVLAVFLFGFIFYIYKRIKFNKYKYVTKK